MLESVLQCPQPHSWIETAANKYSATVEILDSKMLPNDSVQHLFDIQVKPGLTDDLLMALRRDEDLINIETMKSKSGHIYGSATSLRCTVCKEVAKSKCFLASVDITSEGARWTVIGNNDSFRELIAALERHDIPFKVRLKRNLEDNELADRQAGTDSLPRIRERVLRFPEEGGPRRTRDPRRRKDIDSGGDHPERTEEDSRRVSS